MKRNYKLIGLDCANCAASLERGIAKLKGVNSVSISFMTLKMIIDIEDENYQETLNNVIDYIKKFEDGIEVKRC